MTKPPPVAPVEGHYALLRNGNVVGPLEKSCIEGCFSCQVGYEVDEWQADGRFFAGSCDLDIIATISPEAMKLATNPNLIGDLIQKAFDTSPQFTSLKGAIEKMLAENDRLRAALQNIRAIAAKSHYEGGPDGILKTIEEFAVYGLEGKNP